METFGHPTFVIALRFKNIVAFALGKMEAWGLNTDAMGWDQVGLHSHHDVEFSAKSAAPRRSSSRVGGQHCARCVAGCARRAGRGLAAAAK